MCYVLFLYKYGVTICLAKTSDSYRCDNQLDLSQYRKCKISFRPFTIMLVAVLNTSNLAPIATY